MATATELSGRSRKDAKELITGLVEDLTSCEVSVTEIMELLGALDQVPEDQLPLCWPFLLDLRTTMNERMKLLSLRTKDFWQRAKHMKAVIRLPEVNKLQRLEDRVKRLWKRERPGQLR
jgi:hypothetical protein